MQSPVVAKGYERNAWVLVAILGVVGILFSITMLAGIQIDTKLPQYSSSMLYLSRMSGWSLLGLSVFGLALTYKAFRRGERWAWYVVWFLPFYFIVNIGDNYLQGGGNWPLYTALLLVSLAGLLLPYRMFFPKK